MSSNKLPDKKLSVALAVHKQKMAERRRLMWQGGTGGTNTISVGTTIINAGGGAGTNAGGSGADGIVIVEEYYQ